MNGFKCFKSRFQSFPLVCSRLLAVFHSFAVVSTRLVVVFHSSNVIESVLNLTWHLSKLKSHHFSIESSKAAVSQFEQRKKYTKKVQNSEIDLEDRNR